MGLGRNYDYVLEEYEEINQEVLDQLLADANTEIIGELNLSEEAVMQADGTTPVTFIDVRLRRKVDKSGVKLRTIPPESF